MDLVTIGLSAAAVAAGISALGVGAAAVRSGQTTPTRDQQWQDAVQQIQLANPSLSMQEVTRLANEQVPFSNS